MKLVDQMLNGHRLSLARVITKVENRDGDTRAILNQIYSRTGKAFILGITGPPGAGKSTVTDRLTAEIRARGQTVAIVAIDPSSPFTGGAILGDRIRMQAHNADTGVYIRSLGTRGKHGGLSHTTKDVVLVLDAAGFDWVIVETAGVGQTELDILKLAHGIVVVLVPESGDGIQMMKAGLMEIADIFVVNKCDRPESDKIVREIVNMIGLSPTSPWVPPVVRTQAISAQGITELLKTVLKYREFAEGTGHLEKKRQDFLKEEILDLIADNVSQAMIAKLAKPSGVGLLEAVLQKRVTPHEAAEKLLADNS